MLGRSVEPSKTPSQLHLAAVSRQGLVNALAVFTAARAVLGGEGHAARGCACAGPGYAVLCCTVLLAAAVPSCMYCAEL